MEGSDCACELCMCVCSVVWVHGVRACSTSMCCAYGCILRVVHAELFICLGGGGGGEVFSKLCMDGCFVSGHDCGCVLHACAL